MFGRLNQCTLSLYQILSKPPLTLGYLSLQHLRARLVCSFLIQMLLAQVFLQFWCIPHYLQDQLAYAQLSLLREHRNLLPRVPIQNHTFQETLLDVAMSIQKYLPRFYCLDSRHF